jgi:hypothetical protein
MAHHWRWHGSTRVPRWTRPAVTVGPLLACMLLAALPAAASASTPDVRGEWTLTASSSKGTLHGRALITQAANSKGEFAAQSVTWENVVSGTFTGTLEGATATVKTTSAAAPPVLPPGEFNSSSMTVEATANSLALSGSGELKLGEEELPATETLTRVKTQQQVEEQEEKEKREREEQAARTNVRGEWALTLESVVGTLKGTALITEEATAQFAFASNAALFEGVIGGTFSGTLAGAKTSVTITTEAYGTIPAGNFTSTSIAINSIANPSSMSGSGTFKAGESEFPSTLTATRTKTYQEVLEREKAEREAKERETEAREAAERVAREKAEREAKERREREAREALEKIAPPKILPYLPPPAPLMPVQVGGKTVTLSHSGAISLGLTNPDNSPVHGHLKLTLTKGKTSSTKHSLGKSITLGEASFSIAAHGTEVVKVKLSRSARAQLIHHKSLRLLLTVTTQASGQPDTIKTYSLTLRAARVAHGKH